MVFAIGIFFLTLFIIFILFVSKKFSPIPYFPSQKADIPLIINALNLKNDQVVFDLGAGDGIVIFAAAKYAYEKNLNTVFVAMDINPVLISILQLRRLLHPNKKNIKIVLGDMFKANLKSYLLHVTSYTFYLYISPWFLPKISQKILAEFSQPRIVSYMYPIKSLGKREKIIEGKNNIYIY